MSGLLEARACAEADEGVLVTARIVIALVGLVGGLARRASIVAPPCLPVAPVMRKPFDMSGLVWREIEGFGRGWNGVEGVRRENRED